MSDVYTGKSLSRVDAALKVTGKARYSAEIALENVAYAAIVETSVAKGSIRWMDTRAAERAPGVLSVLTHDNAVTLPGAKKKAGDVDRLLQVLQDDRVLYSGQPIGLVVADSLEEAQYAAGLVEVTFDAAAPIADLERNMASAYTPKKAGPFGKPDTEHGDVAGALAGASVRIETTYTTPVENHNPMEPHATMAVWQGPDRVTVYDATQGIFGVKKKVALVFGIPPENVRVVSHYVGGGFGCKGSPWSHVILAAMAAKVVARPVKLVVTRQQMFSIVGHRPKTVQRVALGASRDGRLVAIRHDTVSETSTFDEFVEPCGVQTRMLYACPAIATSHKLVRIDIGTPTFQRAPGESTGTFALESAMDELAYAIALDPLALRLRNYAETDAGEKKPWSSKTLRECYARGAARFGWEKRNPHPRSTRDGRWLVGWGMATATYPARQSPSSAVAVARPDGTLLVQAGSQDIGTGTYTVMAQIAADAAGVPYDNVQFELGDTEFPETPVSGGSQTASSTGSAVKMACLLLKQNLAELASRDTESPLYRVSPKSIDMQGGVLFATSDDGKKEAFGPLVARSKDKEVRAKFHTDEKADRKKFSCHSFGADFVEVRVDEDLGVVRVSRIVAAFAAGKILNPKTARSQFLGGLVWGLGMALEEHTERDPRTARVVTRDLADYHVPVNADIPDIDVIMVDEDDPHVNEIGAKGVGEIGITGIAAAIANAIFHATGTRVRDLPITLDKILEPHHE
jgi:xanthine dehydrogenase YagR molybdenum-binding subunit